SCWRLRGAGNTRHKILSDSWRQMRTQSKRYHNAVLRDVRGAPVYILIHRLVAELFIGQCPEGMEACHKNGDKNNNRVDNIEWGTHAKNLSDRVAHGTAPFGSKHGHAILDESKVYEIRQ